MTELLTMSWYGMNDGWGDVGTGWECAYCKAQHDWVYFYDLEETCVCEECNTVNRVDPQEYQW